MGGMKGFVVPLGHHVAAVVTHEGTVTDQVSGLVTPAARTSSTLKPLAGELLFGWG